ncbi:YbbR-like domain-containing protein [Salipaludibacillus sp. HK11]|uniref:CdaR family protein n=1 Tax=Salipaludibacillus sp. HK11 TaxID=3394320 RepID=UPI0039FC8E8D
MDRLDKLFNKNWFIKLSSVVIAIMLFLMVDIGDTVNSPGSLPGTEGSRFLEEAELQVYYDEENYVLTEAPEFVQLTLRGPQSLLVQAQIIQGQQELYVDLEGLEAGIHYERVEHRGFPAGLSLSVVPTTVRVAIQEKQTASFPVEVDLANEGEIADGYVVGTPSVTPSTIDVTAAKGMIDQIASARVDVDLTGRDSDFSDSIPVTLYDGNGSELELTANPPVVDVEVPVTSPNKEVPIRVSQEGELPDGVAVDAITTDPENVTIYGPIDVINEISFIDLPSIDITEIDGDTTFDVEVPLPDGIERVDPEVVTVEVAATVEQEREFSEFDIDVEGLEDGQSIEFLSPDDGQFDLVVKGSPSALERLERDSLQASLDVDGLSEGEHEVALTVEGPQNLRFEQNGMLVSFVILEANETFNPSGTNENNESNDIENESNGNGVNNETNANISNENNQDTS